MRTLLVFSFLLFSSILLYAQPGKTGALEAEADTLMAHEDYEGALTRYNALVKTTGLKDPSQYFILYKRAVCLYSLQQYEEALTDIDQFIQLQPDFHQGKLLRAFIGRELGDEQVQLSSLGDLLQLDPKNLDLLKWRATAFVDAGLYPEARRDLAVARKIGDDAELEGYMGITYYYEDKPDSALYYFDQAIRIDKTYVTSYLYAGSLCLDQEAYDLALTYLNKGLAIDPQNVSLQFYKGVALVQKEDLTPGCRYLTRAFNAGLDDAGDYLKEYCYGGGD